MEKLKYVMLAPCLLLLLIGCESTITNEDKSVENLESENPPTALQQVTDASLNKSLAEVRSATARYHDVENAEEDGYAEASPFVPGMGYHYVNGSLLDGDINPTTPEALVYVDNPQHEDKRRLVAVEYIIPDPDEDMTHSDLDNKFQGVDGETWHYEDELDSWTLHAWIWYPNPEGIFHGTNPRVGSGS